MKIGIEIEFNLPQGFDRDDVARRITNRTSVDCVAEGYNHRTRPHWKIVTDASLGYTGAELVSPPMEWNDNTQEQVRAIMDVMSDLGCSVNRQCGLHIHHDATHMPMAQMANIVRNYSAAETVIDSIMPRSRRGNCRWAQSIPAGLTATSSYSTIRNHLGTRYRKVNVESYQVHRTVEFRQHSGTLNAAKIIHWVNLTAAIVKYSAHGVVQSPRDIDDLFDKMKSAVQTTGRVRRGSGYAIRQMIRAGRTDDARMAEIVRESFGGRTTERDVRWNRSQMRAGKFADEVGQTGPAIDIDPETEQFYNERAQDLA